MSNWMLQDQTLSSWNCIIYAVGIIFLLGVYGVLQERIMSVPYGTDFFQASTFLVLLTRIITMLVSFTTILVKGEPVRNQAPFWQYFVVALSNVGSTSCSFEALKHISFPTQVLGKSFKMVPVMLWGVLLSRKRYSKMDWIVAMTVTVGVAEFCMTGSVRAPQTDGSHVGLGMCILCLYLVFDGFTPTFQEKIFENCQVSAHNMMLYTNFSSCIICCAILVPTGGFPGAIKFCMDHPLFLLHAAGISTVAMLSQLCIYPMIQEYGALAFAMTMNVRQVVSILASYALYSKPITVPQILGLSLIFAALYYKALKSEGEEKDTRLLIPSEKQPLEPNEKQPLLPGSRAADKNKPGSESA